MVPDEGDLPNVAPPPAPAVAGEDGEDARNRERRAYSRLAVGLWAQCQVDGAVIPAALANLSETGLQLRSGTPLRKGARVRAVVGLPFLGGQKVLSLSGQLAWVQPEEGGSVAGLRFDQETDAADRELLRAFLALWAPPEE